MKFEDISKYFEDDPRVLNERKVFIPKRDYEIWFNGAIITKIWKNNDLLSFVFDNGFDYYERLVNINDNLDISVYQVIKTKVL